MGRSSRYCRLGGILSADKGGMNMAIWLTITAVLLGIGALALYESRKQN